MKTDGGGERVERERLVEAFFDEATHVHDSRPFAIHAGQRSFVCAVVIVEWHESVCEEVQHVCHGRCDNIVMSFVRRRRDDRVITFRDGRLRSRARC